MDLYLQKVQKDKKMQPCYVFTLFVMLFQQQIYALKVFTTTDDIDKFEVGGGATIKSSLKAPLD